MSQIPTDNLPDSTLALLVEGYEFVSRRCERLGSDVFQTRLLGERTICMRGRDAAELLYDRDRFHRQDAAPVPMVKVLFGEGGVQGLDGPAHHDRKAMFLQLLSPGRFDGLLEAFESRWQRRAATWAQQDSIVLYDEVARILVEAVHAWAGVPLAADEVDRRTEDLHAMITGAGTVGAGFVRGRLGRRRAEAELQEVVEQVRDGSLQPADGSALAVIAGYRDVDGDLLDARVAAVELLNVLRPTVAVDRYVVFCALAMHRHPQWRDRLRADDAGSGADAGDTHHFVQEVRRHFPFFPFVAARVQHDFEWRGLPFEEGRRVLLDLYATNHDPSVWDQPSRFDPERFADRALGPFDLLPQGGGDHMLGHRCAGEWVTIGLMQEAAGLLADLDHVVPDQDLTIGRGRVPALPRSGFVMQVRGS